MRLFPLAVSILFFGCARHSNHLTPEAVAKMDTAFSVQDSVKPLPPGAPGEKVIAVFMDDYDWKTHKHESCILPIARYVNGQYSPIWDTLPTDSDSLPVGKSIVAKYLQLHPEYSIVHAGGVAKNVRIGRIEGQNLECSWMVTGIVKGGLDTTYLVPAIRNYARQYSDSDAYFSSSMSTFAAVSAPYVPAPIDRGDTLPPKPNIAEALRSLVASNIFAVDTYRVARMNLIVRSIRHQDLDNDGVREHIALVYYYDTIGYGHQYSYVVGYHEKGNAIDTFFTEHYRIEADSWGYGYEFLDSFDIDGDHVPEIMLQFDGYESTEFEILEYRAGKLRQVFAGGDFGC